MSLAVLEAPEGRSCSPEAYAKRHGSDWRMLDALAGVATFTAGKGPEVRKAEELADEFATLYECYYNYLNGCDSRYRVLSAAATKDLIESIRGGQLKEMREAAGEPVDDDFGDSEKERQRERKRRDAIREFIPLFSSITDEYDADQNGDNPRAQGELNTLVLHYGRAEEAAADLVARLASQPFLEEFNNKPGTNAFYTGEDQLYLALRLSLHLTETKAGMDFLKASTAPGAPSARDVGTSDEADYLRPLFDPERNINSMTLAADLSSPSMSYVLDNGELDVDKLNVLKSGGDAVIGAYITYRGVQLAGLLDIVETAEHRVRRQIGLIMQETLLSIDLSVPGSSADAVAMWREIGGDLERTRKQLERAGPHLASAALGVLAMVGFVQALRKFDLATAEEKPRAIADGLKEVITLLGTVASVVEAASQGLGKEVAKASAAAWARNLGIVANAIDYVLSADELVDNIRYNPDQILPSTMKVASASFGLVTTIAAGVLFGGLAGAAVALLSFGFGFLTSLAASYLEDGYIEKYLNRGFLGKKRTADSPDPASFEYRLAEPDMHYSAYARMAMGIAVRFRGSEHDVSGGIRRTFFTAILDCQTPLVAGTRIELFRTTPGEKRPDRSMGTYRIRGRRPGAVNLGGLFTVETELFGGRERFFEEWRLAPDLDDRVENYTCHRLRWGAQQDRALLGEHLGLRITLADDGSRNTHRALLSRMTPIPLAHLPLREPIVVTALGKLEARKDPTERRSRTREHLPT